MGGTFSKRGDMKNAYKILARSGTDHLGNVGVDGRAILKWVLTK
jgi:hypothetical protein